MDGSGTLTAAESRAVAIARPARHSLPVVVASPHSGHDYPADFVAGARLDPIALRRSEDAHVDALFAGVGALGVPLIKALFPRAYLDPNREAFELDPEMFVDRLPGYVNTRSPRVAAGLGTIPRLVAQGAEIYRGKLYFADALERIERLYGPYHAALRRLVDEARDLFGHVILLDAHSMPSAGSLKAGAARAGDGRGTEPRSGEARSGSGSAIDVVLGDRHGGACAAAVTETAQSWLRGRGYVVACNTPYAGGFTTRHYGQPRRGIHALQIELNRALYMDEQTMTPLPGFAALAADMTQLVATLGAVDVAPTPAGRA